MDPISAGLGAIGLGMQLYGGFSASAHAKEAYGIQSQITGLETQVNDQRRTAMELSARRQQTEIFRNNQRARAMAVSNATNQGAQFGSGLQGGLAQVQGQSQFNLSGVNQNLDIGRNIFGLNDKISQQKLQLSRVQGSMITDQSIGNFGGSLMKSAGTISNIAGSFSGGINLSGVGFNPIAGVSGQ